MDGFRIYVSSLYIVLDIERLRGDPFFILLTSFTKTGKLTRSEATIWRTQADVPVATGIATRP